MMQNENITILVVETNNSVCHSVLVLYNNAYEIFTRAVLYKTILES